jgi:L-ascorbate metabolism protein UlaG (beta-lactamase superfamily)
MKRFVLALPAVLGLFVLGLPAQQAGKGGKGPKGPQPTQISWYGQSFFIITSSKGNKLAIDPHQIPEYGRVLGLKADGVLFSHLHNDHTQKEALENYKDKNFKVIPGLVGKGGRPDYNDVKETFKDFKIRSVRSFHDDAEGMQHGKNTIFVIEVDGWKIVHLGDLGHRLSKAQLKQIGPVDVLMIPVGGVYTLNGSQAQDVVKQLKPKEYVLPMHYGNIRYDDLLPLDEFLEDNPMRVALSKDDKLILNKEKEDKEILRFVKKEVIRSDNTLTLDRDAARPRPVITVLHWWPQPGKKKVKR